jgi:hypothetical protein
VVNSPATKLKSFSINASTTKAPDAIIPSNESPAIDNSHLEIDPKWNDSVDNEQLKTAWLQFAKNIEKENPRLHSILNNHIPTIMEETVVLLKLKNQMQEAEIQKEKSLIFKYLKRQLKNANLSLEIEFVKIEEATNKAFTATDKYKLMMEKNPSLIDLKNVFDLDLD